MNSVTTRRPIAAQNSRNAPGRSGIVTPKSASRASPSSARSATKRSRSKFMLAPLRTAASLVSVVPVRSTQARRPATASAPAGSIDRSRVVEDVLDGGADLVVGHPDDFAHRRLHDRKRQRADLAHGDTVGEDPHPVEEDASAGLERLIHGVRIVGFDADDFHSGRRAFT